MRFRFEHEVLITSRRDMDKIVYIIIVFFFLNRKLHLVSCFDLGYFAPMVASLCMKKKSDLPVGNNLTNFDIL